MEMVNCFHTTLRRDVAAQIQLGLERDVDPKRGGEGTGERGGEGTGEREGWSDKDGEHGRRERERDFCQSKPSELPLQLFPFPSQSLYPPPSSSPDYTCVLS